jgi:hypothetical protein
MVCVSCTHAALRKRYHQDKDQQTHMHCQNSLQRSCHNAAGSSRKAESWQQPVATRIPPSPNTDQLFTEQLRLQLYWTAIALPPASRARATQTASDQKH